jgi:hypothetical protein
MTSSNTLKKIISIASAALLTIGGSIGVAAPASATAITSIKSMGYTMAWLPGGTVESTFTSTRIGFSSQFEMDDVTAFRGQAITISSTNTGFPNGQGLADNVYITFYSSLANRTAYQQISGTQVYNGNNSSVTVPANALAMRVQFSSAFNGDSSRTLAAGTYGSTPHVFHAGTEIPTTNASSGSNLYLSSSSASVEGATGAFTTPATGTIQSTSFKVAGCLNMSAITSSTTYTATLRVNGTVVSGMTDYVVSALGGSSYSEVMGASNSFSSGQLSTWRQAGQPLKIVVDNYGNMSLNAAATQYDATLTLVDQSSTSLLGDCSPATPSGSGTITGTPSSGMTPASLNFTPDSTLGANSSWGVNVYKSSDNSLVSYASGMGSGSTMLMPPMGQMGPGTWTVGESYYAKAVNSVTINGQSLTSALGTASSAFTIPANFNGSGGGGGGGVVIPSDCNPAIVITNVAYSAPSLDPTAVVRRIYNNDPSIGTSTPCLAAYSASALGTLATLNGAVVGTPSRNTGVRASVSNLPVSWTGLTTGQGNLAGRTLNDGDVYEVRYFVGIAQVPTLSDTPTFTASLILNPSGSSGGGSVSSSVVAPTPAIVAPLLSGFTALSRPMISLGGQVALTSGDFTGLTSAKIEGKSLDFILGKTGNLTFTVPTGEAGKTADLLLTFTNGTVNLQNAIKYVAPVVVANVAERSIAIAPGSKKLSEATADQVRAAAFANMTNTSVSCVAYATGNSAAAKAAAIASAKAVCALATKVNPNLTAAPITVVVDKVKARKVGVGIKVYKATK